LAQHHEVKRVKSNMLVAALLAAMVAPSAAFARFEGDNPAPPPAGARIVIDSAFIVGRWTDDEDCGHAVRFLADGAFVTLEGTSGMWRLDGDRLTLSGSGTITLGLVPLDQDTMEVINPDGTVGRSTRCPGDPGATPALDIA
jgi:hypothetical protein